MWRQVVAGVVMAVSLNGCIVAGALKSVQELGLTEHTRRELLPQQLSTFHGALYWNRLDEAVAQSDDVQRRAVLDSLRTFDQHGRIVESTVDGADFTTDAYEAEVRVTVKRLNSKTNMVEPANYLERWVFTSSEGWKIASIDQVTGES